MLKIEGYNITEEVSVTGANSIYRATRIADGFSCILKTSDSTQQNLRHRARIGNEYEIGKLLNGEGAAKYEPPIVIGHRMILVIEDFGAVTLRKWMEEWHSAEEKVEIALLIAQQLSKIHQKGIVHKDIKPENLLVNSKTNDLRIIDFGMSIRLKYNGLASRSANDAEGSPAYLSPEQTGRVNLSVDFRSDLYSLGITLFELFCGSLPFKEERLNDLVYAHIAKTPPSPRSIVRDLPICLEKVISKLIQKSPSNRYQSAEGLIYDLQLCRSVLAGEASESSFEAGSKDFGAQFVLSQHLFGRETETKVLANALESVAAGEKHLILLSGAPGSGKSVLVRDLRPMAMVKNGFFLNGKFDQQRGGIPYGGIIAAIREFAEILMRLDEGRIKLWQVDLQASLGSLTAILTHLVPEMELVLGKQSMLPEVAPEETQARIQIAMRQFFQCIASQLHPILLFLDDLQWADAASFKVVESLMADAEVTHLMIVAAYRAESHQDEENVRNAFGGVNSAQKRDLKLGPLSEESIRQMLTESFPNYVGDLPSLIALLQAKTAGNPYFVVEFLGSLYDLGLFFRDNSLQAWKWDLAEIQKIPSTGNVIEYLCERVNRLEPIALELLKLAACIGSRFELRTLALITGRSFEDTMKNLEQALVQNFIFVEESGFVLEKARLSGNEIVYGAHLDFVHDRVREAVYSMLTATEKATYHLRIGQRALQNLDAEALEKDLFEIVTHLNHGADLLTLPVERDELAKLNIRASKKALQAAAFSVAMQFTEAGMKLLSADAWETHYETAYQLHLSRSSLLFLLEGHKFAEDAFKSLMNRTITRREKVQIINSHLMLLIHVGEFKRAEELAFQGLALYGIKFGSAGKIKFAVLLELIKAKFNMMGKSDAKLLGLPRTEDPEIVTLLEFYSSLTLGFAVANADLFALGTLRGLNLMLKKGVADPRDTFFHPYGMIQLMAFGNYEEAYKLSKLSIALFDRHPTRHYKGVMEFGFLGWIALWKDDIRDTVQRFESVIAKSVEYGDMTILAFSGDLRIWHMSLLGYPLPRVHEEAMHHLTYLNERSGDFTIILQKCLVTFGMSLEGKNPENWSLDGHFFNFNSAREKLLERGADAPLGGVYTKWMPLLYFFEKFEVLLTLMEEGHRCIEKIGNTIVPTEYYLFETLIIYRLLENKAHPQAAKLKKQLAKNHKMIAVWNKRNAFNFAIFQLLVLGEEARYQGHLEKAESLYDQAIAIADEKNWVHLSAVANELGGRLQLQRGRLTVARAYLQEARSKYLDWGADAKVKFLETSYRDLLPQFGLGKHQGSHSLTSSIGRISVDIDLESMLESSRVISSQIKVQGLLRELMGILIKNAGAEKGFLMIARDGKLFIEAKWEAAMNSPELIHDTLATDSNEIPQSILHYVEHKRENVIVEHAGKDNDFSEDPYFKKHQVLSVMCIPVVKEGRMLAMIYLENNQAPSIFTPERVQMIQMLSGQIAVSIDNALVYENLEHLVEERTLEIRRQKDQIASQHEALEKEKQKSEDLLLNILPKEIAEELKASGKAKAQKFDQATVMFTDIVGFTRIAETLSPDEIVKELDICFSAFDRIQKKYGLEKVKTIGDAYMCMAGVPVPRENSPIMAVFAGLEMQQFMAKLSEERKDRNAQSFEMRLGMHTGEVVAGVVGTEKFAYDIWGDTVNLAARLESAGEPGKVNISAETYRLVKDYFECEHRGQVSIKNKADVDMYFVVGLKEPAVALLAKIQ